MFDLWTSIILHMRLNRFVRLLAKLNGCRVEFVVGVTKLHPAVDVLSLSLLREFRKIDISNALISCNFSFPLLSKLEAFEHLECTKLQIYMIIRTLITRNQRALLVTHANFQSTSYCDYFRIQLEAS